MTQYKRSTTLAVRFDDLRGLFGKVTKTTGEIEGKNESLLQSLLVHSRSATPRFLIPMLRRNLARSEARRQTRNF